MSFVRFTSRITVLFELMSSRASIFRTNEIDQFGVRPARLSGIEFYIDGDKHRVEATKCGSVVCNTAFGIQNVVAGMWSFGLKVIADFVLGSSV